MFYCKECKYCKIIRIYDEIITYKHKNGEVSYCRLEKEDSFKIKPNLKFQNNKFYEIVNKNRKEFSTITENQIQEFIEIINKYPCKMFFEKKFFN